MPRQSREKSDTGIYHVMLRGINRQDIFEDEEDYRKMILFLRGLVERTDDNGLRIQPSCRAVLSRIPRGELAELVCSPVEEYGILDIDADTDKHVSDSEIRAFLLEKQGIANPLMVQSLEKGRRDEVLRSAKLFGAGIRQLSRLTGVSFGVIQKT